MKRALVVHNAMGEGTKHEGGRHGRKGKGASVCDEEMRMIVLEIVGISVYEMGKVKQVRPLCLLDV